MIHLCVVNITDAPEWILAKDRIFQIFRRETGSTPAVGSSKSIRGGAPINASAMDNFLLFPPLVKEIKNSCLKQMNNYYFYANVRITTMIAKVR